MFIESPIEPCLPGFFLNSDLVRMPIGEPSIGQSVQFYVVAVRNRVKSKYQIQADAVQDVALV